MWNQRIPRPDTEKLGSDKRIETSFDHGIDIEWLSGRPDDNFGVAFEVGGFEDQNCDPCGLAGVGVGVATPSGDPSSIAFSSPLAMEGEAEFVEEEGESPRQYCKKQSKYGLGTALTESIALPLPLFALNTNVPFKSSTTSNFLPFASSSVNNLGSSCANSK